MANGLKTANIIDPNDDTRFVAVDPYVIEGVARCQFFIDQTSSGHPVRGNYNSNVASTTDTGAGDTTVSFTNSFSDNVYKSTSSNTSFNGTGSGVNINNDTVDVKLIAYGSSNSAADSSGVKGIINGELA